MAQSVKAWSCILRVAGSGLSHCRWGCFPGWAFSKPLTSVGSEHHGKNNGGLNQWIGVEIT